MGQRVPFDRVSVLPVFGANPVPGGFVVRLGLEYFSDLVSNRRATIWDGMGTHTNFTQKSGANTLDVFGS